MLNLPAANEYLRFQLAHDTGKTQVWLVMSRHGDLLGVIRWFGRWRQYAFQPEPNTTFNPGCLDTITENIRGLMNDRKRGSSAPGDRDALLQPSATPAPDREP